MLGTITNCCTILAGSVIGATLHKGIKQEYQDTMMNSLGLAALSLGISNFVKAMPNSQYPVLFIFSMAFGGLIGSIIDLDGKFQNLAKKVSTGNLAQGLTTAVLLFCIGTMSILGPIESALNGNNTLLFTNAMLDGVTSMILASNFGIGIAFSAVILFLWQGSIYLLAQFISSFMTDSLMTEISIVGGILIMSSALGILNIKSIKTLNLLPALLVPALYIGITSVLF